MQWYATLEDTKNHQLQEVINSMQETTKPVIEPDAQGNVPSDNNLIKFNWRLEQALLQVQPEDDEPARAHTEEPVNGRPSEYLRERCPACFEGSNWHQPDEI